MVTSAPTKHSATALCTITMINTDYEEKRCQERSSDKLQILADCFNKNIEKKKMKKIKVCTKPKRKETKYSEIKIAD